MNFTNETQSNEIVSVLLEAKNKLKQLEEKNAKLETQVEDFKSQVKDLESQVKDLKSQVEDFKSQVKDLESQVEDFKSQVADIEANMTRDYVEEWTTDEGEFTGGIYWVKGEGTMYYKNKTYFEGSWSSAGEIIEGLLCDARNRNVIERWEDGELVEGGDP